MGSKDNSEPMMLYILAVMVAVAFLGLMLKHDYDWMAEELESCRLGKATWEPVFAERNSHSGELRLIEEIVE